MAKRRRPTDEDLANLLSIPNPGTKSKKEKPDLPDPMPASPVRMILDIEELEEYEHNPRTRRNPRFEEIKESIRTGGLDQPLVVSRRPGAKKYTIYKGGNTRLRALAELYQETGDQRFKKVVCEYRPWEGDLSAVCAHLRENEMRGEMTFIEKARAIEWIRNELEKDRNKPLSSRELSKQLTSMGLPLSHTSIAAMRYAMEVLYPVIPDLLDEGLGRPQVEAIRQRLKVHEKMCREAGVLYDQAQALAAVAAAVRGNQVDKRELDFLLRQHLAHLKMAMAPLTGESPSQNEPDADETEKKSKHETGGTETVAEAEDETAKATDQSPTLKKVIDRLQRSGIVATHGGSLAIEYEDGVLLTADPGEIGGKGTPEERASKWLRVFQEIGQGAIRPGTVQAVKAAKALESTRASDAMRRYHQSLANGQENSWTTLWPSGMPLLPAME